MIYRCSRGKLKVTRDNGDLFYCNDKVIKINVFSNGNLLVEDVDSVVLVSDRKILTINTLQDYVFSLDFVIIVE